MAHPYYEELDKRLDKKSQTACFTGHRQIPPGSEQKIKTRLRYLLDEMVASGYRYFGVGGSYGFDMLVTEYLLERREQGHGWWKGIKIIVVCPFKGYWKAWPEETQRRLFVLLKQVDKVVYVSEENSKEAYLKRNRHLVDNSSMCISYCTRNTGGTAYTIRYAHRQGVPVKNASSFNITNIK